ncbi:MAG: hypothetical protein ACNA8H_17115, partial [Anaerolineales bacterium]
MKHSTLFKFFTLIIMLSMVLGACGPSATETPEPTEERAEPTEIVEQPTEPVGEPTAPPVEE